MESAETTNQLLKTKYNLHKSDEVIGAADRTRLHTGKKVPQDPIFRIQNYLDRLDNLINPPPLEGHPNFDRKERNIEMLKSRLHDRYVIKPGEIPESFWENQRRIIRERGQGGDLAQVDFEELKRQNTEALIADQRSSLDKWADYLASPDSAWAPDALKYWAFRSVLDMAEYDKEKKEYPKRSKGTTKPFPDLNREALAYVLDAVDKKYKQTKEEKKALEQARKDEGRQLTDFEELLTGESFPKLYAFAIEKVTPASAEQLAATSGEWVKYNQGLDHMPLVKSLQGHGTGWCTAGESTAQAQLQGGDFYVYYSLNQDGKPTVPRVAIRMEGPKIAEVRGIAADQNLDSGAAEVVDEKLKEFPDGASYKKRVHDMELLTILDHKAKAGQDLTGQELAFLYEIDSSIEGFGYSKDPRIAELRSQRNPEEDMPIVFGCERRQIARNSRDIRPDTKAYVGSLEPGIFDLLAKYNIDHIYTKFPEGIIRKEDLDIESKTKEELKQILDDNGIKWRKGHGSFAESMIDNPKLPNKINKQSLTLVTLKVSDLGFGNVATTDQIYTKAQELGLELCPPEAGPEYRIAYKNQPMGEWRYMAMDQIAVSHGYPNVFGLERHEDGVWLHDSWAGPDSGWHPGHVLVFSLRKHDTSNTQPLGLFSRIFKR